MIKMPVADIIEKIVQESGSSEDEVKAKIDEKMKQLSGLISEEGAAHIVANELGVKLFDQIKPGGKVQIKNILAGMRSVDTLGQVTNIFNVNEFQRKDGTPGKVGSFVVGDESSSIRVVLWGNQTELMQKFKEGDVVKIVNAYSRENNNNLEIHLNDKSELIINPEGEKVEAKKRQEAPRKTIASIKIDDDNVELVGTVVQSFDLRFFEVCPVCKKRIRQNNGAFKCEHHDEQDPDYSYVMNVVLDDGTSNVRTAFFRNQVQHLIGKTHEEVLKYKEDAAAFEAVKTEILGQTIKVIGRPRKNDLFDRLEFNANLVFTDVDPEQEIDKVKEQIEKKPEPVPSIDDI